jgi:tRNA U34 5-carboxymethylaminomethyl modifying GTPase MnmE/TrmE
VNSVPRVSIVLLHSYRSTAGSSFTSQPLLELHLHSSLSVLSRTLSVLSQLSSHSSYTFLNLPLRPAERGEFTRQAFLSGRMDLTEVEGLRDLIEAETEGQRKLARSMVGVGPLFRELPVPFPRYDGGVEDADRDDPFFLCLAFPVPSLLGASLSLGRVASAHDTNLSEQTSSTPWPSPRPSSTLARMTTSAKRFLKTVRRIPPRSLSITPVPRASNRVLIYPYGCRSGLARNQVKALVKRIENHLDDNRRGEIMRSGLKVAIFGPPNAGKVSRLASPRAFQPLSHHLDRSLIASRESHLSRLHPLAIPSPPSSPPLPHPFLPSFLSSTQTQSSLMNHLAHRDAAIVSPVPGTTRDVVTVSLDLGGSKVILSDTAGLRETEDEVEKIGVGRAGEEVLSSPLQILVLPLPSFLYPWTASSLTPTLALLKPYINPATTLLLLNQSDLLPPTSEAQGLAERVAKDWQEVFGKGIRWWKGSIETGEGMEGFLKGLEGAVGEQ